MLGYTTGAKKRGGTNWQIFISMLGKERENVQRLTLDVLCSFSLTRPTNDIFAKFLCAQNDMIECRRAHTDTHKGYIHHKRNN